MFKIIHLFIFPAIAGLALSLQAQIPPILWSKAYGGSGNDVGYHVKSLPDGGYLCVGETSSSNGDVTGAHGFSDAWVLKLNNEGIIEWQKALGGSAFDLASSAAVMTDGGYLIVGGTSSIDGDVTIQHGMGDLWVIKLSATGDLIWQKTYGGSQGDIGYAVIGLPNGEAVILGETASSDGDVTSSHGSDDLWLIRLDASGGLIWERTYGGSCADYGYGISPTMDDGFLLVGYTCSSDGDVTGYHGGEDLWVVKTNSNGDLVWQQAFGGSGSDYSNTCVATMDGGFLVLGKASSVDGDVTGLHGFIDAWLVKLNSAGALEWQVCLGGTGEDSGTDLLELPGGDILVTAVSNSSNGQVIGAHGSNDGWLVRLNSEGSLIWQRPTGGMGSDSFIGICAMPEGGYAAIGSSGSSDGDILSNHGQLDLWLVKFGVDHTAVRSITSNGSYIVYPNPVTNDLYVQLPENERVEKLSVFATDGTMVFSSGVIGQGGFLIVPCGSWVAGSYILLMQIEGQSRTIPLVKN